jgi:hypothetical protein
MNNICTFRTYVKKMDEKLISDITGFSIDRVRAIKKDNLDKIH